MYCHGVFSADDDIRQQRINNSAQYNLAIEQFENTEPTPTVVDRQTSPALIYNFFFSENERRPKQKLPEDPPTPSALSYKSESVRFAWLGHSTILLELDGKRLLLDPIFSNYASPVPFTIDRFQPPAISLDAIDNIDLVVISHDHYDHLDKKTIKRLGKHDVSFLVPLGVGAHLESWGIDSNNITELDWWESKRVFGLELIATPAQHFSGRWLFDNNKTLWASWTIVGQKQRVFFSGDSGYGPHYAEIGRRFGPFDIAFLENGAYDDDWPFIHQMPEQAVQANTDLRSNVMLPIHWGMFDLGMHSWYEPIERVTRAAQSQGVRILTPLLGQLVTPDSEYPQQRWWEPLLPTNPAAR